MRAAAVMLVLVLCSASTVGQKWCSYKNWVFSCDKNNLRQVPLLVPGDTRELDLSFNRIPALYNDSFTGMTKLQVIDVSKNRITGIEEATFRNMKNLTLLNLSGNRLKALAPNVFENLSSLQRLRIDRNRFQSTAAISSALLPLVSLQILNMNLNKVTNIHLQPEFARLEQLRTLDLAGNPISSLQAESFQVMKDHSLTHLSLASNNLSDIPKQALMPFASVKEITFSNHELTAKDLFSIFSNTRGLGITNWTLSNNNITELTNVTFSPLIDEEVIYISLNSNNISQLTDYLFASLSRLRVLSLGHNPIQKLSVRAFAGCDNLQELGLDKWGLGQIPSSNFEPLANLTRLNLASNLIRDVQDRAFMSLPKLRILQMHANRIETVAKDAFYGLHYLEDLNLGANNIRYIPSEAFRILSPSLKKLDLSANRHLKTISPNLFHRLHQLTDLKLNSCYLQTLRNSDFAGLYNLQRLDLSYNLINVIDPDAFHDLWSIKVLNLDNNILGTRESARLSPFRNLTTLTELHYDYQRYTSGIFSDGYIEGLTSLRLLSLTSLKLVSLESKTNKTSIFKHMTNLRYLQLTQNNIGNLTRDTFAGLTNLKYLFLFSNFIRALPEGVFRDQGGLQYLDLRNNGIVTLSKTVFNPLKSLVVLNVYSNSFACTCDIEWFRDWTASSMNVTSGVQGVYFEAYTNYTCASPKSLRNKPLIDINFDKLGCKSKLEVYVAIGLSVTFFILIVSVILMYRYHWYGRYAMFLLRAKFNKYELIREEEENPKTYDAFVAHNSHDSAWVIRQLLPQLERGDPPEFRLCLGDRDFQPGAPIVDNIAESIYESRKTICVITRNFLESDWCRFEMQMATYRLFEEHVDCLIVVFLEQIPAQRLAKYHSLRRVMCRNTYLEWPEDPEARDLFWERLRVALRTHRPLNHDFN
ncbi:toll-like receptor 13 [Branchiostoma lanceolatum]|uniref:toll-like receptor 13 n=1 Tax=Branchiostoma lanceolatum TaxID=7740 RepID=UPI003455FB3F